MPCLVWLKTLVAGGKLMVTFYGSGGLIVMYDREERKRKKVDSRMVSEVEP